MRIPTTLFFPLAAIALSAGPMAANAVADDLAPFQKAVDEAHANLNLSQFPGPTARSLAPKGLHLVIVECDATLGGCVKPAEGAAAAARKLDWTVEVLNGEGKSQRFNQLIQSAVAGGAKAIMTDGIDAKLAAAGLARARAQGIPVISLSEGSEPSPTGFNIDVSGNIGLAGEYVGDYVVLKTAGKAHVLPMADDEYITAMSGTHGFEKAIGECKTCVAEPTMNFISADISTRLKGRLISYLTAHPGIDWIYSPYDPAVTGAICPAIREAGLADKVHVVSVLGLPANLDLVKKQDCQLADATWPQGWNGWAGVDQLIRILNKQPTVVPADEKMPVVLLDGDHLPANMDYEGGKVDVEGSYLRLWGKK